MNRTDNRRLTFLCSESFLFHDFKTHTIDELYNMFVFNEAWSKIRREIYTLFKKNNFNKEQALAFWSKAYTKKRKLTLVYDLKPIKVRQDNKTSLNIGNGRGGLNSIRYPKKVRKTAWKRFYKLFPNLQK